MLSRRDRLLQILYRTEKPMSTRKGTNAGDRLFRQVAPGAFREPCHRGHRQRSPAFARSAACVMPACGKETAARLFAVNPGRDSGSSRSRKTVPAEAGAPLHGIVSIRVLPADHHHPATASDLRAVQETGAPQGANRQDHAPGSGRSPVQPRQRRVEDRHRTGADMVPR